MTTKNGHDQGGALTQTLPVRQVHPVTGKPKFELGVTLISRRADEVLRHPDVDVALHRHARGDWGDVGDEDWEENERSLREGLRLLSVHHDKEGTKFWIITEWDRSVTTILLPEDY